MLKVETSWLKTDIDIHTYCTEVHTADTHIGHES